MYDKNVNLSTVLIITLALMASGLAVAIGVGALDYRWALAGGILVIIAHGLAVRHWIICARSREREAFDFGRESVRSVR